jgi:hypothetical protein
MKLHVIQILFVVMTAVQVNAQVDSISLRLLKEKEQYIKLETPWFAVEAANGSSRDLRLDVGVLLERCTFIRDGSDTLMVDSVRDRMPGGWLVKAGDTAVIDIDFTSFESKIPWNVRSRKLSIPFFDKWSFR